MFLAEVIARIQAKNHWKVGVAHCHFSLRTEADLEKQLVESMAKKNAFDFFFEQFDTSAYAEKKGVSIQMAARELRYKFFNELKRSHGFDYLLTAHHKNDLAETLLLNLIRNSGPTGLTGIPEKNKWVLRPFLFLSRSQIDQLADSMQLEFMQDASNDDVKYKRNFIRHKVLPELETLNPDVVSAISNYGDRLSQANHLLAETIANWKKKLFKSKGEEISIAVHKISKHPSRSFILFELLNPFGFNGKQIEQLDDVLFDQSGKEIFSENFRLIRNRKELILSPIGTAAPEIVHIARDLPKARRGEQILEIVEGEVPSSLSSKITRATLDMEKVAFPLIWRSIRIGDYFYPFGLLKSNGRVGKKKISKYLKDEKFSLLEKEKTSVLEDANGRILWLVGHRIDNRFAITGKTKKVLFLNLA